MKVVSYIQGGVAARMTVEEILPDRLVPRSVLCQKLIDRYSFMSFSQEAPLTFNNGQAVVKDGSTVAFPILHMLTAGDVVYAQDTDTAEEILDDVMRFLDAEFGYRFSASPQTRTYQSVLIVDFDGSIRNILSSLYAIECLVGESLNDGRHRGLKRLSFALPERDPGMILQIPVSPLDSIADAEFVIERRVGSTTDQNRYFCGAPLKTSDHIALLEKIEKAKPAWS